MPHCGNCGSWVSRDFERVFSDPRAGGVRACPRCEDRSVPEEYSKHGPDGD